MTDRERLIEILKDTLHEWECDVQPETLLQIAEHLLENGVIVPPCKVGDTVYAHNEYFGILPYLVGNFHIGYMGKEKDYLHWEAAAHAAETDELLDDIDFDLEDIGKDIFFTREEAEKALAEQNCDIAQNIESCEDCGFCEKRGASDG